MATINAVSADEPDPQVQAFLQLYESMDIPELHELTPEAARDMQEQLSVSDPGIEIADVQDREIPGHDGTLDARLYEPRADPAKEAPLLVFFHGGGWVVGSLKTHDAPCRKLASETGYPVLSVGYRLAPEHPFPAALNDCYSAVEWAMDAAPELHADPTRIAVAGDSAGGNLAAGTALLARDRDGPDIAAQLLVYPATGNARETASFEENAEGYFLTRETMAWFQQQYVEDPIDQGNIYALPRLAADLSDLPPAIVLTAGFDPLRDDGAAYAQRLQDADIPVRFHNFEGMIHGFFNMIADPVNLDVAHEAHEAAASDLRDLLDE